MTSYATDRATFITAFERQVIITTALGSPLLARLFEHVVADLAGDGPAWRLIHDWQGDPAEEVLPLRLSAGLHLLAIEGRAPELARHLPSLGGTPEWPALWQAACALMEAEAPFLRAFLRQPPQTNEVGRTATLLGGFLTIAAETGRPLALREIGASGGLILRWDQYRYETDAFAWGDAAAPVTISARWYGKPPPLNVIPIVTSRRGCDIAPVDITDAAARNRLLAYVWPDQAARIAVLRDALAAGALDPPALDRMNAGAWLAGMLAERPRDEALVVHHSYVWAYLSADERANIVRHLGEAGARATAEAPLAWLRMEPTDDGTGMEVLLTLWPGGATRRLALCQAHGRWIDWQGPS